MFMDKTNAFMFNILHILLLNWLKLNKVLKEAFFLHARWRVLQTLRVLVCQLSYLQTIVSNFVQFM